MIKSLLLIMVSISIGAVGQLSLKAGMLQVGRVGTEEVAQPLQILARMAREPLVVLAIPLYGLGFLVWSVVLSRVNLSMAYPLLAATYLITPLGAWLLFHETISITRWIGIAVIFIGVVVVAKG